MARVSVLLAAICFGTTGTAQALGPDGTDPLGVGAGRIVLGAVCLAAVAAVVARPSSAQWDRRRLAIGGIGVAAYQLAFFAAVKDTGVAVGTVVAIGSGPAFAGLLGRLTDQTPLTRRWAVATALACAGVALLVLGGGSGSVSLPGVGLALAAGAGYATYTVTAKGLLEDGHAPEAVMAATFGVGGVLLVPVLLATAGDWLLTPGGIGLVAYLAVVPTAVAYVLFARGLRHLPAGEAATLTLAEPLTATALGALVLAERPSAVALAGAGLVLAGLVALATGGTAGSRRATPAPPGEPAAGVEVAAAGVAR
jgi:DME family drug/metabolite transporter